MAANITGEVRNAFVIQAGGISMLYGEIYNDTRKRFADGAEIRTSPILEHEGNVYITKNSVYEVTSWAPGYAPEKEKV